MEADELVAERVEDFGHAWGIGRPVGVILLFFRQTWSVGASGVEVSGTVSSQKTVRYTVTSFALPHVFMASSSEENPLSELFLL